MLIWDESSKPTRPQRGFSPTITGLIAGRSTVTVTKHGDGWTLEDEIGDVQPQATVWSADSWHLGTFEPKTIMLNAKVYADNLPNPYEVSLHIKFSLRQEKMTIEMFKNELNKYSDDSDNA